MAEDLQASHEFLTREESAIVDRALLSARDKFSTRLAIYALRSLKQISGQTGLAVEDISKEQVANWIENDQGIQGNLQGDASFKDFFTNLVTSSLKPLQQVALDQAVAIADLTVSQVVAWFEHDRRMR